MSYLRQFPISDLKVDRSFITDLGQSEVSTALARAIADLGHTLGLSVIAEGVETQGQLAQVRALGFQQAQGYLISPPLPAAEARKLAGQSGPLMAVPRPETGPT